MRLVLTFMLAMSFNVNLIFAGDTAQEIMDKVAAAAKGYKGDEADVKMTLLDSRNSSVEREMKIWIQESHGQQGAKSLIEFIKPTDVKGTKFLSWVNKNEDNFQWLYLPALKKVKKITGSGQAASFMGSEFSYEDISGQDQSKFDSKLLAETKKGDYFEWVLEQKPKKESGYSKIIITVGQKWMSIISADYYNKKNELEKKLLVSEWKEYTVDGKKLFRPQSMSMANVLNGKTSKINWINRQMGKNLSDTLFNSNRLEK